jgi:hypothetical protein
VSLLPPLDRRTRPHLRCGICDETFEQGESTRYVDDERVHVHCARDYEDGER